MGKSIWVIGACLLLCGTLVAACGDEDSSTTGGEDNAAATSGGEGSGAGGDDRGSTVQPTSESKEDYVAKANALCKERTQQIQMEVGELLEDLPANGNGNQRAGLRKLVEKGVAPGLEAEIEELRELGAPEGDEKQIEEILAAIEATITEMRKNPKAFVDDPKAFARTRRLAGPYGIGQCGKAG